MGYLLGRAWSAVTHVISVDETTMAVPVEEVCFVVIGSFHFVEKIIEQYFAILLRHIALWMSTINLDFTKSYETLSEMAVSWVFENNCELSNLSVYIAGLYISRCHFCIANPLRKNFPIVAVTVVSSTETTCVTADHVRPNKFPFIAR